MFRYTIVLYSTIQYIKVQKIRKFAHNQTENNQTNIEQYYREDDEETKNEKICRQRTKNKEQSSRRFKH